jgi:putative transposase
MARLPRLAVAHWPHLVLQRGIEGRPVFADAQDQAFWLMALGEAARAQGVAVHAYSLQPDQWLLLATPDTPQGLSRCIQDLGRRYVRYFNNRHARRGPLWEGRYRATVLQPERHLLDAMVLLDLLSTLSGRVGAPSDDVGSAHAHHIGLRQDRLITPHALYWQLGNTPFAREAAYAERVRTGLGAATAQRLLDAARSSWALGDDDFLQALQPLAGRRLSRGRPGRPRGTPSQAPGA